MYGNKYFLYVYLRLREKLSAFQNLKAVIDLWNDNLVMQHM